MGGSLQTGTHGISAGALMYSWGKDLVVANIEMVVGSLFSSRIIDITERAKQNIAYIAHWYGRWKTSYSQMQRKTVRNSRHIEESLVEVGLNILLHAICANIAS